MSFMNEHIGTTLGFARAASAVCALLGHGLSHAYRRLRIAMRRQQFDDAAEFRRRRARVEFDGAVFIAEEAIGGALRDAAHGNGLAGIGGERL